jgi:hypothetical protein
MTRINNPLGTADPAEYYRREREIAAKARAGLATVEDYIGLGYPKLGALWMVDPELVEAWADEWHLWCYGTRRRPVFREMTEADFPPFPPFSIKNRDTATGYEWMRIWANCEPYPSWLGIDGESNDPDDANDRWMWMLATAEEPARNLDHDIHAGTIPLVKRAYTRNRWGKTTLDITRCVIAKDVMLDFAQRIGGYGSKIAALLAEGKAAATERQGTEPKARRQRRHRDPKDVDRIAEGMRMVQGGEFTANKAATVIAARDEGQGHSKDAMRDRIARGIRDKLNSP